MNPSLYGTFEITPEEQRAYLLWIDYYERTEAFDRTVCYHRSPRTGNAIPVTEAEYRACAQNAYEQERRLNRRRHEHGPISDDVWESAQRRALMEIERQ